MKKTLAFMILGLFMISMIGVVSATSCTTGCSGFVNDVVVGGTIWDSNYVPISGTQVNVACNSFSENVTTNSEGEYGVEIINLFHSQCAPGDTVTVTATDYGISKSDTVADFPAGSFLEVDLVIINVIVPEFGVFLGALTIFSAVGIFAFVRKG